MTFKALQGVDNFNPRSPQGGATQSARRSIRQRRISIHAPRKGERQIYVAASGLDKNISIHAPRKGERP